MDVYHQFIQDRLNDIIKMYPGQRLLYIQPEYYDFVVELYEESMLFGNFTIVSNPKSSTGDFSIFFIVGNSVESLKHVITFLQMFPNNMKVLMFLPHSNSFVKQLLIQYGYISINWGIPNDFGNEIVATSLFCDFRMQQSCIIMPTNNSFRDIFLYHEDTYIENALICLKSIESIYGMFSQVISVGDTSKRLANALLTSRGKKHGYDADLAIIIDRSIDLLTPMLIESHEAGNNHIFKEYYLKQLDIILGNRSISKFLDQLLTLDDLSLSVRTWLIGEIIGYRFSKSESKFFEQLLINEYGEKGISILGNIGNTLLTFDRKWNSVSNIEINRESCILYNGYIPKLISIIRNCINATKIESIPISFHMEMNEKPINKLFVFVVGGITLSEISLIRNIEDETHKEIMIMSTEIITCHSIIQSLLK